MTDFFDRTLPTGGETCFATLYPSGTVAHKFRDVTNARIRRGQIWHAENAGASLYFALATFKDATERSQRNVQHIKSFYFDIDAGEAKFEKHGSKVYETQQQAFNDLTDWLAHLDFIEPTFIVSSGAGWHVYWVMTEALSPEEWLPVAHALRRLAVEFELKIDGGVTIDYAHILRLPDSLHQKTKNRVTINYAEPHDIEFTDFKAAIERHIEIPDVIPSNASEVFGLGVRPSFAENVEFGDMWSDLLPKYKKDFTRCITEQGCLQLIHCYDNQNDVDEPLWYAALSVIYACEDAEQWAIEISKEYKFYEEEHTLKKLRQSDNRPHTCHAFDVKNPNVCPKCPHWGKIKSPATLTLVPLLDVSGEAVEVVITPPDKTLPSGGEALGDIEALADLKEVTATMPALPRPYFRHTSGGVWEHDTETDRYVEIYPHDIYIIDRMYDARSSGEVMLVRFLTPRDGLRTFTIPMQQLANQSSEALRTLAFHGVVLSHSKGKKMADFLRLSSQNILASSSAQVKYDNFGWTDSGKSFVLGGIEFFPDNKARAVIPTERIDSWIDPLTPPKAANWKRWAELSDMYNYPGMEPSQFTLASVLSGPLYALNHLSGGIIHLYSQESGTGKTSAAEVGLSIWGLPTNKDGRKGLSGIHVDTTVATLIKASVFKSFASYIDEITTRDTMTLRDLVYTFTQGRDKDRGDASSNTTRENNSSWEAAAITSGNTSLHDSLGQAGDMSAALLARILEVPFTSTISMRSYHDVQEIEDNLNEMRFQHYGSIGQRFVRHLLNNAEEAKVQLRATQKELNARFRFTQSERYWAGMIACTVTALNMGRELGFWKFESAPILEWLTRQLKATRAASAAVIVSAPDLIMMFLSDNIDSRLVLNKPDRDRVPYVVRDVPSRHIYVREELHTGMIYIRRESLQAWCAEHKRSYTNLRTELVDKYGATLLRIVLAADTKLSGLSPEENKVAYGRQWVIGFRFRDLGIDPEFTEHLDM